MKMVRTTCALLASIASIAALADPTADGLHDLTFGNQGFARPAPYPRTMTIDAEGRFTLSGYGLVARHLPNGLSDPAFGDSNGTQVLDTERANLTAQYGLGSVHAPIPGGGFYAVVMARRPAPLYAGVSAVFRLNSDGTYDSTYGTNGIRPEIHGVTALEIEPDGKPVLFGAPIAGDPSPPLSAYVLRLTTTGARDPTFNGGYLVPIPAMTTASDILRAADGSYYVTGEVRISANPEQTTAGIAHVLANGALDPAFGHEGLVTLTFGVSDIIANSPAKLAQQADGKILMVGYSGYYSSAGSDLRCVAARLHSSDGTLDSSFATGGKLVYPEQDENSQCADVALTTSGRILLSGRAADPRDSFLLALNQADGSVDRSFGIDGLGAQPRDFNSAISNSALVLDAQQRIVSAGLNVFGNPVLYRLTSDRIFADALDR